MFILSTFNIVLGTCDILAGIWCGLKKITTIQQRSLPMNVKKLCSFLGLVIYYLCLIHHYASIAGPITNLLRKEPFMKNTSI